MLKPFCVIFLSISLLRFSSTLSSSNTSCDPLHVAAFNIKVFGATKASKSGVMSVLANITQRYDVMLVQEIRDINMLAIYQLLDLVNSNLPDGDMYDISLSERTGRSSSKEQWRLFCFFYNLTISCHCCINITIISLMTQKTISYPNLRENLLIFCFVSV